MHCLDFIFREAKVTGGLLSLGFKYFFYLIIFLQFSISIRLEASNTCEFYLLDSQIHPRLVKSLERLKRLDSDLYQTALDSNAAKNDIDFYIFLKSKAWQILPFGSLPWKKSYQLPEELKFSLSMQFGHQYRIDELNSDHLAIFYANSLQSIYSSVVHQIFENRFAIVQDKLGFKINDNKIKKYILAIIEKEIAVDLRQAHVEPGFAQSILIQSNYLNFDWINIIGALNDYISLGNFDTSISFDMLSNEEKQILIAVFQGTALGSGKDLCCKNSSGCIFCPNNLGFIKK